MLCSDGTEVRDRYVKKKKKSNKTVNPTRTRTTCTNDVDCQPLDVAAMRRGRPHGFYKTFVGGREERTKKKHL